MRVLAIDPGYDRCGVAVIEKAPGEEKLLYSSCITTHSGDDYSVRLLDVGQEFEKLIKEWQPNLVALEKLFFATNRKTANQVSEVRGVLIFLATKHGKEIIEFTPMQIKQTVAGWGGANKKQVAEMVKRLIKLKEKPKLDDEYDAIAVGLTACALYPQLNR